MSTPETSAPSAPTAAGRTKSGTGLFGACAVIATLSVFWMATERHYDACVEAQVAKYPAVPVSAFNTKVTGPIKVAYDAERRAAVGKCKHFLFV